MSRPDPAGLRLRVTAAAESILRGGHPWLYAESVREQNRAGRTGELAVVFDRKDRFLAIGLYDAESPIRVRVLHRGKPRKINRAWWEERFQEALNRRRGLFEDRTTGYRWINGESDGWPGLVLDRYGDTLVLKLYTAAWAPWLDLLCSLVREQSQPRRLVLRLSRNLHATASETFGKSDGDMLLGPPPERPVIFLESGLHFQADVVRGQKTGFFLDQRENRRRVESLARGRAVLNAFSFSGGFSVYAARGGARSVTDLDLSAHALESARGNFALNQGEPALRASYYEQVQADAFEWLKQAPAGQMDLVVLDPPSLARREVEQAGAIRAYQKLTTLGLGRLAGGGVLVACSCSAHVSAEDFFGAVRHAARASRRPFTELETRGHAPDHPATFKEGHYLKAIYLQLG